MDIEKIRTLIALMEESELVNLEISSDDEHISLTRHYDAPAPTMMAAPTAGAATPQVVLRHHLWLAFITQPLALMIHHL